MHGDSHSLKSWKFYLISEFSADICWEKVTEEIILFSYFRSDVWFGVWTVVLLLVSQYTTYWIAAASSYPKLLHFIPQAVFVAYHTNYYSQWNFIENFFFVLQGPPNTIFLENALKKTTEYFLKFLFLFKSTIFLVQNGK